MKPKKVKDVLDVTDYNGKPIKAGDSATVETMMGTHPAKVVGFTKDRHKWVRYKLHKDLTIGSRPAIKAGHILEAHPMHFNQGPADRTLS